MNTQADNQSRKFLFGIALAGLILFLGLGMSGSSTALAQEAGTAAANPYYTVNLVTLADGTVVEETIINGPPAPPPGFEFERRAVSLPEPDSSSGMYAANSLTVPAFDWVFGCSSVSGAMIAGYYDRNGYPNMYTGPTNGGVMPLNNSSWPTWSDGYVTYPNLPLAASKNGVDGRSTKGSIDDYWVQYDSTASDPYITGGWGQHTWGDAIGDYMKTSQSAYGNSDGSTIFYTWNTNPGQLTCSDMVTQSITKDGTYGRKLFYEARGYTVTDCYNQKTDNNIVGGFSFAMFKAEIDAGRPVMINLEGHTVAGVGYDDTGNTVYIHDTWDYSNHSMTWGGSYSGMVLKSVSIVNLASLSTYPLTVSKSGSGSGTVTSSPPGINCGSTCSYDFASNTVVTLTATPTAPAIFSGWSGAGCSGTGTCIVTMSAAQSVSATFNPPGSQTLTVSKSGAGSGTVTSSPPGINCGSTCSYTFASSTVVTLTATPIAPATFGGWSGAGCSGTGTCIVTMDASKSVTANFALPSKVYLPQVIQNWPLGNQTLTVSKSGSGSGTVTSSPPGINCGATCSYAFANNTVVTLTATPTAPATFGGWSGAGCAGTGTCVVTMSTAQSVSATFNSPGSGIVNGDFESGRTGWTEYSYWNYEIIMNSGFPSGVTPRSGLWAAWLGGADNELAYIQQQVTVPAGAPYLTYYHWIASKDVCGYDFGEVLINGAVKDYYYLCTDNDTLGWVKHSVDLSAYAGQSVKLQIGVETDDSFNSNLFVDDVSFQGSAAPIGAGEGIVPNQDAAAARGKGGTAASGLPAAVGQRSHSGIQEAR